MLTLKKILCPIDFSELSLQAMHHAIELAATFGAELHLLHVFEGYDTITLNPELAISTRMSEWLPKLRELCRDKLAALPEPELANRCPIVRANCVGSAVVEICDYSTKHQIDLIVLATHGRTGLKHLLMGSVAENVVRTAKCPVLTIRAPAAP